MVYWNMYWYLNSDGEPDFTGGEGGLEFCRCLSGKMLNKKNKN